MANMRVEYSNSFRKKLLKAPEKIQQAFVERGKLFSANPFNTILNNHKLTGKYEGYRSINITGDWRAVFREFQNYSLVWFEILGTHSELYK